MLSSLSSQLVSNAVLSALIQKGFGYVEMDRG